MPCIRLNPSISVVKTGAGVFFRSDLGTFQLTGADVSAFLERIVPLLDGSRDREALIEALPDYSGRSVTALLDALMARRLIEPVPEAAEGDARAPLRGQEEFFRAWSVDPAEATRRLAGARVLLVGLDPWLVAAAIELAAAGVGALALLGVAAPGEPGAPRLEAVAADLRARAPRCRVELGAFDARGAVEPSLAGGSTSLIVASISPDDAGLLERVARLAHRERVASLWSHLAGSRVVLGPLVTPGETACRVCMAAEPLNPPPATPAGPPCAERWKAAEQLLGHLLAMEVIKVLSGYSRSELGGRVMIQDLATFESSRRTLVRLPWCRVCG